MYSTQLAVSWFKVNKNKNPTKEEFRKLVVDFMKDFENTLSKFSDTDEGTKFKNYTKIQLEKQIQFVMDGKIKKLKSVINTMLNTIKALINIVNGIY